MLILKKYIFIILAVLLTFFAIRALFNPGFFPIHDDEQIGRLFELNYSLESLHIPPRISQNLGFGYGYPFFNFYPPFVYYFAEVFKLIGFSYIDSTKIMIAFGFIFSSFFMYLFSKEYWGKWGGLVAAALYTYAPYHSVDVYVRGAIPESWSFVFLPAIFLAMLRLSRNPSIGNIIFLGLFGVGLILTHNLVALMAIPFMFIYFIYLLWRIKNRRNFVVASLIGGIIAILLSAYFSLPALLENKYTMVSLLTQQLADYNLHFVSFMQFFNSTWGYGGSILGPKDGLSLEVGKIHLILIAVSFLSLAYLLFKKKAKSIVLILFLGMFLFSLFLQSYYSKPVWDNLKMFSYIQFPWRFMLFAIFFGSFIAGFIFTLKMDEKKKGIIACVLILTIILFYGGLFKPSKQLPSSKDTDYISQDVLRWKTSIMAFEYVPFGIGTKKSDLGTTIVDIEQNEVAKNSFKIIAGEMNVKELVNKPQIKKFEIVAQDNGRLQINTYSFPGWKVFKNGQQISYNDKNKLKLITIDIDAGKSLIEARFTDTPIRRFGNTLSLIGAIAIILLLPFCLRKIKL